MDIGRGVGECCAELKAGGVEEDPKACKNRAVVLPDT